MTKRSVSWNWTYSETCKICRCSIITRVPLSHLNNSTSVVTLYAGWLGTVAQVFEAGRKKPLCDICDITNEQLGVTTLLKVFFVCLFFNLMWLRVDRCISCVVLGISFKPLAFVVVNRCQGDGWSAYSERTDLNRLLRKQTFESDEQPENPEKPVKKTQNKKK